MRRALLAALISLVALAATTVGFSQAAGAGTAAPQWATVNVCHSGAVGVRANMPGAADADRMQMRLSLQWFSPVRRAWLPVPGNASSGWLDAGPASQTWSQQGFTFTVNTPGRARYLMRGIAELRWTRSGATVNSALLSTGAASGGSPVCVLG